LIFIVVWVVFRHSTLQLRPLISSTACKGPLPGRTMLSLVLATAVACTATVSPHWPRTASSLSGMRMMASADEILRRSGPAHPPSEADRARRARRALQLGWAIRAETGDNCQGQGVQRTCARCVGTGAIGCSFCGGAGAFLLRHGMDKVQTCRCRVCQAVGVVPCSACAATGRVAAWAEELDALGDSERRMKRP